MQNPRAHRIGRHSISAKKASVSAQKVQIGRSGSEKVQKNSTAPPTAPTRTKPRSCPDPRRSKNKNAAAPTTRQYPPSSSAVNLGARTRKGRSRSYSRPADRPNRMDCPNTSSCWGACPPIPIRRDGSAGRPGRTPGPHRSWNQSARPHGALPRPETACRCAGPPR